MFAGPERSAAETLDVQRFEIVAESAYLLGVFGNPNSYEIGAEFVSARIRWSTAANMSIRAAA
jgi:hypothetical protein